MTAAFFPPDNREQLSNDHNWHDKNEGLITEAIFSTLSVIQLKISVRRT